MGTVKSFFERHNIFWLGIILVVSTYIKFVYTFYWTEYHNYLYGEMGQIWQMAAQSFYKGDTEPGQWLLWPPTAHIVLSWIFKILYLFDLYQYKLEAVLGLNVFVSSFEVLLIYLIAFKVLASKTYALFVSFIYAFFFPLAYLNAFVLTINPALFLYMLSIVVLLYADRDTLKLFLSGMILGLSVSFKPAWLLSVVPFVGYLILKEKHLKENLVSTLSMMAGFVLVVFFVIVNNNAISAGRLKALSANEGIEYYLSMCKKYQLISLGDEYNITYSPDIARRRPELGTAITKKPTYEQLFFYKKGAECAAKNTYTFKDRIDNFVHLYRDAMFPAVASAKFSLYLLPLFDKIAVALSVLLFFVPLLYFDERISKSALSLMITLILSHILVLNSLYIQQRDLYGFFFMILIIGVLSLFSVVHTAKKLWWAWIFGGILVLGVWMEFSSSVSGSTVSRKIAGSISQNKNPIYSLDQEREIGYLQKIDVDTIDFNGQYILKHSNYGHYDFDHDFFMDFRVGIELEDNMDITFITVADDGCRLKVDGRVLINCPDNNDISEKSATVSLTKGRHRIDLSYFQHTGMMTLRSYYQIGHKRLLLGKNHHNTARFFYINKDEYFARSKKRSKRKSGHKKKRTKKHKQR